MEVYSYEVLSILFIFFLSESALTVNQPRSGDITSQCCPLQPQALDWQTGYAGVLFSRLWHWAVMWHLESHITFLLLLPQAVNLDYCYYYYYFYPCCYRHNHRNPPSDTRISLCKSLCAQNSVKNNNNKKSQKKTPPSSLGGNLCPKPKENRWKQADWRVLALGRQSCPAPCIRASPPCSGLTEHPGRKGWSLLGLLIITMVSAIHSLYAQSSWDVHRGLKHRETDPERPEKMFNSRL